jgi:PleD family two-component response regulator
VTIVPPPKEDPKLPGSSGPIEAYQGAPAHDSASALTEALMALLRGPRSQTPEAAMWQRRRVLICSEDSSLRETLRAALDPSRYEIFSADLAPEAIEILHESRAEVIVLSPNFDLEHQGGAALMQYVNSLTAQVRRRTYVVLVSPQMRTHDTYLAFANGVNLTLHPEDAAAIESILDRSVRDFNELYRPYNFVTSSASF